MVILDANMILRYLLNDKPDMAAIAENYITNGDTMVTIEVIAEVVYVLKGVYLLDRTVIGNTIQRFLRLTDCLEMDVLILALDTYENHNLDFVDCVLYAYHRVYGADIATFDRKLINLLAKG